MGESTEGQLGEIGRLLPVLGWQLLTGKVGKTVLDLELSFGNHSANV